MHGRVALKMHEFSFIDQAKHVDQMNRITQICANDVFWEVGIISYAQGVLKPPIHITRKN